MRRVLLLFITLLYFTSIGAKSSFSFRRYLVEQGLSNNFVWCFAQDINGFIWIGTPDGLNRFDGYTFKTFRNNSKDPASIGSNNIRSLFADHNGSLWVGTKNGLYIYNPITENFINPITKPIGLVSHIVKDNKGFIWLIADYTLYKINSLTFELEKFDTKRYFRATTLCYDNDQLWVATASGEVAKYNPADSHFVKFKIFQPVIKENNRWIENIYPAGNENLLVGTATHGAKIFSKETKRTSNVFTHDIDNTTLFARNFLEVQNDVFWIGTESGIFTYSSASGITGRITKSLGDPYTISDNSINALFKDVDGGIWVGTSYGGISYYSPSSNIFENFYPTNKPNSLNGAVVREIHKDKAGLIWIGTEDGGLNRMDPVNSTFSHFEPDGTTSTISYKKVHSMLIDGNELWVGTYVHGLDVIDTRTGLKIRHYPYIKDLGTKPSDLVNAISHANNGDIVLCTIYGVYRYKARSNSFEIMKELPEDWYTCFYQDKSGVIWAGTNSGLISYDPQSKHRSKYTHTAGDTASLEQGRVNTIFLDSKNQIWIGTENGLCLFNDKNKRFTNFNIENGMPSSYIFSILEDNANHLWVTTSKGLVCKNLQTGYITVYKKDNGLPADQFNYNSAFKDNDGTLYFGGLNGLVRVYPNRLTVANKKFPIYLTSFEIDNKEIEIGAKLNNIRQSITTADVVELSYDKSSFNIGFAALNFSMPEATKYAYFLKGLDTGWILLNSNRKAYFTNLPPGRYEFHVKAASNDNLWSTSVKILTISISPPWWLSKTAFLIDAILIMSIIILAFKIYSKRIKAKTARIHAQEELEKAKEIYREKLDFFTNIAHEIKTPLTLIKGPLYSLLKKKDLYPEISDSLKMMNRNTDRLVDLTNQFLDFRQTEINSYQLTFVKTDISEIVREIHNSFNQLATSRNLSYIIMLAEEPIFVKIDVDAFIKILTNLYTNALKYADSKIVISITKNCENDLLIIDMQNDGYLIPLEFSEKIFDPFVRLRETNRSNGTGIGLTLALSLVKLHGGSLSLIHINPKANTFRLTLPIT